MEYVSEGLIAHSSIKGLMNGIDLSYGLQWHELVPDAPNEKEEEEGKKTNKKKTTYTLPNVHGVSAYLLEIRGLSTSKREWLEKTGFGLAWFVVSARLRDQGPGLLHPTCLAFFSSFTESWSVDNSTGFLRLALPPKPEKTRDPQHVDLELRGFEEEEEVFALHVQLLMFGAPSIHEPSPLSPNQVLVLNYPFQALEPHQWVQEKATRTWTCELDVLRAPVFSFVIAFGASGPSLLTRQTPLFESLQILSHGRKIAGGTPAQLDAFDAFEGGQAPGLDRRFHVYRVTFERPPVTPRYGFGPVEDPDNVCGSFDPFCQGITLVLHPSKPEKTLSLSFTTWVVAQSKNFMLHNREDGRFGMMFKT